MVPAPAGEQLKGRLGILEARELAQRLGIPGELRPERLAEAPQRRRPGVLTIAAQPSGREATTPARTNDVLPAPEGPINARSRRPRSFSQSSSTSCSLPKKWLASASVNEESPG